MSLEGKFNQVRKKENEMVGWQPCGDHDWMKEELKKLRNNRKFWHRLLESKWCFWVVTGIVTLSFLFIAAIS